MGFKRLVILLMPLVMLLCFGCKKHNHELQEVINVINNNLNKINNYVADYSIKEDAELTFLGEITFVKPDITRIEIVSPQNKNFKTIIYYNNDLKYIYFPHSKQAIKEKLVKKTNKKYNFIYYSVSRGEEILSLAYHGKVTIGQEDFFELIASMGSKGEGALTDINTFLVDIKTGCIREFSYRDHKTGKKVIYEFKNYKINTPITIQEIELKLPKDVRMTEIN